MFISLFLYSPTLADSEVSIDSEVSWAFDLDEAVVLPPFSSSSAPCSCFRYSVNSGSAIISDSTCCLSDAFWACANSVQHRTVQNTTKEYAMRNTSQQSQSIKWKLEIIPEKYHKSLFEPGKMFFEIDKNSLNLPFASLAKLRII